MLLKRECFRLIRSRLVVRRKRGNGWRGGGRHIRLFVLAATADRSGQGYEGQQHRKCSQDHRSVPRYQLLA
jgi:hypothetical protein